MNAQDLAGSGWKVSKYKREYCDIAYNYMRGGKTYEQLARHLGTSRGVLNGWRKRHAEFEYACECGRDHGLADWETLLEEAIYMKGIINVSLFKFVYKNRFAISLQLNQSEVYKPISLRELYESNALKRKPRNKRKNPIN